MSCLCGESVNEVIPRSGQVPPNCVYIKQVTVFYPELSIIPHIRYTMRDLKTSRFHPPITRNSDSQACVPNVLMTARLAASTASSDSKS